MTWHLVAPCDLDALVACQDAHDLDRGVVVFPARRATRTGRAAVMELLAALGKDTVGSKRFTDEDSFLSDLAIAWLTAERVTDVIVIGAQRWVPPAARAIVLVATAARCRVRFVMTADVTDQRELILGPPGASLNDLLQQIGRPKVAGPAAPFARLRRCFLPTAAAAAVAYRMGADPDQLENLPPHAVIDDGSALVIGGQRLVAPLGCGVFLRAQQVAASRAGAEALFSRRKVAMRSHDIVYSALVGAREADIELVDGDEDPPHTQCGSPPKCDGIAAKCDNRLRASAP